MNITAELPVFYKSPACYGIVLLMAVLTLAGCATSGQRVSLDCVFGQEKGSVAATFEQAAGCTNTLVKTVHTRLKTHEETIDVARLGTILGTLGATTAALYAGHRDLIVGLGLVGGASYAYGSLYAPPPYLAIFSAGLDSATCVDGVARQAAGSAQSLQGARRALIDSVNVLKAALTQYKAASEESRAAAGNAVQNAENQLRVAAGVVAKEPHFANAIVNVSYEISGTIDQQLIANMPNLQAFRDASQQALAIAQGFAQPTSVPTAPVVPKKMGPEESAVEEDKKETAALDAARQVVTDNSASLAAVLKVFANPDASACAARARNAGIKPFAILPAAEEISIASGTVYSISASGGQPPYHGFWAGTEPPSAEVQATRSGDTFRLEGKGALKQEYSYVIRDSASAEKRLKIKSK